MKVFAQKSRRVWTLAIAVGVMALAQQAYANLPSFGQVDYYTYYSNASHSSVAGRKVISNCDSGTPDTATAGVVTPYFSFKRTTCSARGW